MSRIFIDLIGFPFFCVSLIIAIVYYSIVFGFETGKDMMKG